MPNALVTKQISLFPVKTALTTVKQDTTSTFSDNMTLPVHRWFRYSAGFSATWVRELIKRETARGRSRVLDPFAGSGTVLIESEFSKVTAAGIESHPFVARIARAKLLWRKNVKAFRGLALATLDKAQKLKADITSYPSLIEKCYPPQILSQLDTLRQAWETTADGSPYSKLTWLALTAILRECSPVGTAQWQYVLPNKTKARAGLPYDAFLRKVYQMSDDMTKLQQLTHDGSTAATFYQEDTRQCPSLPDGWADLIITSPPYANNYDYADATRLEMSFWREIEGWGDLQDAVRKYLVRSCTQHVARINSETYRILESPFLNPIREEITTTCQQLEAERQHHGGKKPYHTMIATYFHDMAEAWVALRRVTTDGALVCFVIGDSAPYGIYVPVDRWLGELAVTAGFKSYKFEKTRNRNIKWKNRKHRVPLHEGRLWIKG